MRPTPTDRPGGAGALTLRHILTAVLITGTAIALLGTTADPDLWGHVRFGQDILNLRSLSHSDPYSFTSDRPWINHEWLAEVAMALAFQIAGASGLNLLRLAIIGLTLALVWSVLKDVGQLRRVQLVAIAGLGVLLRVHPIRPQLFSVFLFAMTLWLIRRSEERQSAVPIAWMPLVMAMWVNLHGGWIVGLGTLGLWIAGAVLTRRFPPRSLVGLVMLGLAAVLATALNPYGTDMWRFLADTVRVERPMITDWQPTYSLPLGFAMLWLIPASLAALAVIRAPRADRTHLVLVLLLGVAALRVSRLDAFFALTTALLLGPLLSQPSGATEQSSSHAGGKSWRQALVMVGVVVIAVGAWQLPRIAIPPGSPEPEAARYIRQHGLEGRIRTWFDWGEYAIWHLSPRIRVSIDGRRETTYTASVTANHLKFYAGAPGFEDYPDRIGADYVWIPRELPVVPQLRARGWRPVFEGPVSVLLARSSPRDTVRFTSPGGRRLFPSM